MPKVVSHTPSWLRRSTPGFDLFSGAANSLKGNSQKQDAPVKSAAGGCSRSTIARRGTEVFVVVNNTVRWADLAVIKDEWETKNELSRSPSNRRNNATSEGSLAEASYRTLKVPVHEPIQQLIMSPSNKYLAIVTSHTVHVSILPDPSHLGQPDAGPLRIKTYTIGPTIHVLSQSPVALALWHPLAADGDCLVTVTVDAVVRLWELDKSNRWSYDNPALDIDLTRLHFARSAQDNVKSSRIGDNRGFSVDSLGMQVASATFGGSGSESEQGWSPMTLWIAMAEGDVYAMCPLIPSKWRAPATLVPSLTTANVAKKAYAEGPDAHEEERRNFSAQFQWLSQLDSQDPVVVREDEILGPEVSIYERPDAVGPIPKLQGPFRILPGDLEDDLDLTSMHVIAPKLRIDDLLGPDEEVEFDIPESQGLSVAIVCLLSKTGRVYVCLNLEEVEGQWLPLKKPKVPQVSDPDRLPALVLLEALDTLRTDEISDNEWPTFTCDVISRYSFFINNSKGVFFFSLEPWIEPLENELESEEPSGAGFRLGALAKSSGSLRERIMRFEATPGSEYSEEASSAVIFNDSDLGYFLLTAYDSRPQAVILDSPLAEAEPVIKSETPEATEESLPAIKGPPRAHFEPPAVFFDHKTALNSFLEDNVSQRQRAAQKEEIRLSSATLDIMTKAHRMLSQETTKLGFAAADVFRRCERLQEELKDQIHRAQEISQRIDQINDEDADEQEGGTRGSAKIEGRLKAAQDKQAQLAQKYDALRRKLAEAGGKPLSDSEVAWTKEVKSLESNLIETENVSREERNRAVWQRIDEVKKLMAELIAQAKDVDANTGSEPSTPNKSFKVPSDLRKTKMSQIMELLEREKALVDATEQRLSRLSLSTT